MSDKQPHEMSAGEFKRKFRMSSGWPNVQREVEDRAAIAEANAKEKAMLEAGAKLVKRGPGRPPKFEESQD